MRTVYTDGACSGNPGPGGWAWVEVDGAWRTGFEADSTNQRMEVAAVISAVETFDGPLRIFSDSTYVVNCWKDRLWAGWLKRGWKNSQRKPVANRDLWERLVPHFRDRTDLELVWVKGHSGDRWNDIADRLAVAAVQNRRGSSGSGPPTEDDLGDPDLTTAGAARAAKTRTKGSDGPTPATDSDTDTDTDTDTGPAPGPGAGGRSAIARGRDGRVPEGFLVAVTGVGSGANDSAGVEGRLDELTRVLGAWAELHRDALILTGLRGGAESLAASAATAAQVPYVVVLPYPDPTVAWPRAERERFESQCRDAASVVTLERSRPGDADGRLKALARRDGWLRSAADMAVLLADRSDPEAESGIHQWTRAFGDDLWLVELP